MRPWQVTAAVCALLIAGCSDPASKKAAETDFSDVDINVSETTGAIRGIVVDERITPVAAAVITLTGSDPRSTMTDDQGRFVFDELEPGTYFMHVRSPMHKEVQSSVDVEAGVAEPPLTRIQLQRLFEQEPFMTQVDHDGFFECSQEGASWYYSSSTCVAGVVGPLSTMPPFNSIGTQDREWHSDVLAGWQTMVFEMTWKPTSQSTSTRMGMVVSTYKPERSGSHWFAEFEGGSPVRGQLDVGVEHESASGEDPEQVPTEGMSQMSYFVSVRAPDNVSPGIAINQAFKVYLSMFHYGRPPEGWAVVNGDSDPF